MFTQIDPVENHIYADSVKKNGDFHKRRACITAGMSLGRGEGRTENKQTGDAFRTEQRCFEFMKT